MLSQSEFFNKLDEIRKEVQSMTDVDDPENIRETADRLKGLNYASPVYLPLNVFLELTSAKLLAEIDRIVELPDDEVPLLDEEQGNGIWQAKLQQISILVFYFRELASLRRGVPEAWDEVDELYVHD